MRQYWRDFDALERWARLLPRKQWGQVPARLLRHRPLARDLLPARGIEAIYVDTPAPLGLLAFAPARPATGTQFSARRRARLGGQEPVIPEAELERSDPPTKQVSTTSRP